MSKQAIEHLESALYQLKEKYKTANGRETIEAITDAIIEIATLLEQTKEVK